MQAAKTLDGGVITAKSLTAKHLEQNGWTILENDSQADILAERDGWTLLVDVDRDWNADGLPRLYVDRDRSRELTKKALYYLGEHGDCKAIRVDVIAVSFASDKKATLRHLIGVYESKL